MNRPLPCESYASFKLKFVYEFLTTGTEGVVHGVHKVVIRSSFGVIWLRTVSEGIDRLATCFSDSYRR